MQKEFWILLFTTPQISHFPSNPQLSMQRELLRRDIGLKMKPRTIFPENFKNLLLGNSSFSSLKICLFQLLPLLNLKVYLAISMKLSELIFTTWEISLVKWLSVLLSQEENLQEKLIPLLGINGMLLVLS